MKDSLKELWQESYDQIFRQIFLCFGYSRSELLATMNRKLTCAKNTWPSIFRDVSRSQCTGPAENLGAMGICPHLLLADTLTQGRRLWKGTGQGVFTQILNNLLLQKAFNFYVPLRFSDLLTALQSYFNQMEGQITSSRFYCPHSIWKCSTGPEWRYMFMTLIRGNKYIFSQKKSRQSEDMFLRNEQQKYAKEIRKSVWQENRDY